MSTTPGGGDRPADDDLPPWAPPRPADDELPPWAPPGATNRGPTDQPPFDPPPFEPPDPVPASPAPRSTAEPGAIERGGAAAAALGFGLLAGLGLPPLLFWPSFGLARWVGLPDLVSVLVPLAIAFGVPIFLLLKVQGILRQSTPRYDGARSALTVAASVTLGMWLLVTLVAGLVIVALRSLA